MIVFLSFILSASVEYGINVPRKETLRQCRKLEDIKKYNWGWHNDKYSHTIRMVNEARESGFPLKRLQHSGIQTFIISFSDILSHFNSGMEFKSKINVYKMTAFLFYIVLFFTYAYIGKRFFALTNVWTNVLILAVPFFNAVNFRMLTLKHSSYLGSFSAGTSMFHNCTQFFSITLGSVGILLLLFAHRKVSRTFIYGCLLITISFFFKPSLYTVLAPAVIIFFLLNINIRLYERLLGIIILFIPPVFWTVYPLIFDVDRLSTPLRISPFDVVYFFAKFRIPKEIYENWNVTILIVLIFSFMVFIPIIIDSIIVKIKSSKFSFSKAAIIHFITTYYIQLFYISILTAGISVSIFLVEDSDRAYHGNFLWTGMATYIVFLPLLIYFIKNMRYIVLKVLTCILLTFHIWGGLLHLYLLTYKNKI